ncbi:MAG: hypothetical protein R3C53_08360 [Pirellulaceae bacterium]
MILPSVLIAWMVVGLGEVEVVPTGSSAPYSAELLGITPQGAEVSSAGETRQVPLVELRRINFDNALLPSGGPVSIHLRDGSRLNAEAVTSDGTTLNVKLTNGSSLSIATALVRDVRLRELVGAQAQQWETHCQSRISGDMLVLIRSADAVDTIEGIVHGISAETVDFEFSGEKIPAPVQRIAGIRFFSKKQEPEGKVAAVIKTISGGAWNVASLELARGAGQFDVVTMGGFKLTIAVDQVHEIDFSVGSMLYLAELEPLELTSTPRFELGIAVPGATRVFGPRAVRGELGTSVEFLGGGSITYRVPPDFTRLVGAVELTSPGNKLTPCVIKVLVEKKVVFEQRLAEPRRLVEIDLAIQGDQRVGLVVEAESPTPVGDIALFRDLRFLK